MSELTSRVLGVSEQVRYVAVHLDGELELVQRPGIEGASAAESDRYEELLVNPTLLTLTHQRGAIDCGGLEYVLVRYGNFFQLVQPVPGGHVSVAIEATDGALGVVEAVRRALEVL